MLAMMSPYAPTLLDVAMADLLHTPDLTQVRHDAPRLSPHAEGYALSVNAPGVKVEDVKIEVEGGRVTIHGETRTASHTHFVDYTVTLPKDANPDMARAEVADGVIQIILPKKVATAGVQSVQVTSTYASSDHATSSGDDDDDDDQRHVLSVPAAGIAAADLSIEVKAAEGVFKVSGESKRTDRKLTKYFRIPRDAEDAGKWQASQVDGLLTLTIPKKKATTITARRVEVSAAEGANESTEGDAVMV